MAIPSVEDWLSVYDVSENDTPLLDSSLERAIRKVKREIGFDAFEAIFESGTEAVLLDSDRDVDTTTVNEDAMRLGEVTDACFDYAMYFLLLKTGVRIRPRGLVKKETDAGSPALSGSTNITNEYLTPKELAEMRDNFLRLAEDSLDPYRLIPEIAEYSVKRLLRG